MIPVPTPDQAVHVLKILGEWTKRGWTYEAAGSGSGEVTIVFPHPVQMSRAEARLLGMYATRRVERCLGVNHFDAICQATTVMQMLLEEYPEKAES